MKFQKFFFITLLAIAVLATSCKNGISLKEDALVNVPATTASVTSINVKKLMDKADFKEVIKLPFYKRMVEEVSSQNPGLTAVLNDPYESGVDLSQNAYWAQDFSINNPEDQIGAMVVTLSDGSKFEKLISENGGEIKSGDGFEYSKMNQNALVAWNGKIAVLAVSAGRTNLKEKVAAYFNTKKENSIVNNKDLQNALSKKADIIQWISSDGIAAEAKKSMGMQMAMAGLKADMLMGNSAYTYTNFEDGEIVANSEYTINKDLANEFRHIFKDEVETDFSKYIPGENMTFAVSGALDMAGIKMILEKKGVSGMADMAMREYGISVEDIAKSLDGDFVVSGYNANGETTPKMLIGTKIKDRKTFDKFILAAIDFEMLTKESDGVYAIGSDRSTREVLGDSPKLVITKDMLFIGGDNNTLTKIQSGGFSKNERADKKVTNVLNGNILGAFVDFDAISQMLDSDDFDLEELDDAIMRMDRDDATFKLELKDKKTNSLKSLIKWINKTYEKNEGREAM